MDALPTADVSAGAGAAGASTRAPLWIMARTLPPADPNYSDAADPHGDEFSAAEQAALPDVMAAHPQLGRRIGFDHGKASAGEWVDTWHDPRDGSVYSVGYIDSSTLTGAIARQAVLRGITPEISMSHVTITDKTTGRRLKVPVETTLTNAGDRHGARIVATWAEDTAAAPESGRESAHSDYMQAGASSAADANTDANAHTHPATMSDAPATTTTTTATPPTTAQPPTAAAPTTTSADAPASSAEHTVPAHVHIKTQAALKALEAKFVETQTAAKALYEQNTTLQSAAEEAAKLKTENERLAKEIAARPALQRAAPGSQAEGAALAITEFLEAQLEKELPSSERDSIYALAGMLGAETAVKLRQANAARSRKERAILEENNKLHRQLREQEQASRALDSTEALLRSADAQPWMNAGAKRARADEPARSDARAPTSDAPGGPSGPASHHEVSAGERVPQFSGMSKFAPDLFKRLEDAAWRSEFGGMPAFRDEAIPHLGGKTLSELALKDPRAVEHARAYIDSL